MRFLRSLALLVLAVPAFAGGFYIELHNPTDSAKAVAKDPVLVARLVGCHQPEKGKLIATAEGTVDGKRQSLPVTLVPLSTPGAYAVERSWPEKGTWVIHLAGSHPQFAAGNSTLVKVSGAGFDRASAKFANRPATRAEIESFLE